MTMRQSEPREPRTTPLTDAESEVLEEAYVACLKAAEAYYAASDAGDKSAAKKTSFEFDEARRTVQSLEQSFGVGYYGTWNPASLAKMGIRQSKDGG